MAIEVFVVDDEPDVVSVLREVVEAAGFAVSAFARADEAAPQLAARQPAVLVTDLRMPGASGLELLREARRVSPDTQVVILTGYGDLGSAVEALRLGAYDYLAKPVDAERLVQTVRNGVERRRLVLENHRLVRGLQESNRLKTEFINGVSHEVRTPLGQVLGYAQLLRSTGVGLTEKQHRYLQSIQDGATRVLNLFENILQFSTLQSGDVSLTPVPVSLPALLDEVRQIHHDAAELRRLAVEVAAPERDRTVIADLEICRKVLSLLLDNAIKFTPEGGRIVLGGEVRSGPAPEKTPHPLPPEVRSDRWLHLSVGDSGPGIPAPDQRRVFNLFEQGDASLTRNHQGTGLGLALALSLARLHGGTVALASTPGAGSTFTLVVPLGE
jgi:signal transduction histidine kinase